MPIPTFSQATGFKCNGEFHHELGFVPLAIDGKRYELRVELTKKAKEQHKRVRLRYRPEYIPVFKEPEWAH
jgi:hypothetical protein